MGCSEDDRQSGAVGERSRRGGETTPVLGRRGVLTAAVAGLVGTLAGCFGEPSFPDADVIAGSDGDAVFEPAELTVPVGTTVTWGFPGVGHNVCCRPEDSDEVALPENAEPFASYGPNESPNGSVVPRGETYEHTFDVAGEYVYVCIPHVAAGMIGTVRAE